MSFTPPFCPYVDCDAHIDGPFRWQHRGTYRRKVDGRIVPRFLCRSCRRTFSSQTFRLDYRLHRPELTARCFDAFVSKVTIRQCARVLGCRRRIVEHRLRLLGRHLRAYHFSQLQRARARRGTVGGDFQLDELETFENHRKLSPLTVPVLVGRRNLFVVHVAVAPLPCRGRLKPHEQELKAYREAFDGKRRSGSRAAVDECMSRLARGFGTGSSVRVETDRKTSYAGSIRRNVGKAAVHVRRDSKRRRDRRNPLFPINHTLALMRDGVSRLVRRSWGASKLAVHLEQHLWIWVAWRNYVRPITNQAPGVTAAMSIGVADRMVPRVELLRARRVYGH